MNRFTDCPMDISKSKKIFTALMLLFCALPLLLETAVVTPIYVMLESDVAFSGGLLTMTIFYFKDLISIFAFASAYAILIFSVFFVNRKAAGYVILLYSLTYFLQIPCKLGMNIFIYGSLGNVWEIINDIIYCLLYFLIYMIQLLAVYLFATTDTVKYLRFVELKKNKSKSKKGSDASIPLVLPISKLFDRLNPIQHSAAKMSVLVFGLKVLSRVLNDISYGAPTSFGEVLIMIAYYLSDILYGIAAYLIALLIFGMLYDRLKKSGADEALAPSAPEEYSIISED